MGNSRAAAAARHAIIATIAIALCAASVLFPMGESNAAGSNRGGVVVDLANGTVKTIPITFSGSITGVQALQLAGFSPAVRSFGGLGGAVCALNVDGTQLGCPTDSNCLTCAAPKYWVYFRAPAGSSGFSISRAGAGSTTLHDGDIEGWRWQSGNTPPPYVSINTLFPTSTTQATSATTAPPTTRPRSTTTRVTSATSPTTQGSQSPSTRPTTAGNGGITPTTNATGAPTTIAGQSDPRQSPNTGGTTTPDSPSSSGSPAKRGSDASGSQRTSPEEAEARAAGPPVVANTASQTGSALPIAFGVGTIVLLAIAIISVRVLRNRIPS